NDSVYSKPDGQWTRVNLFWPLALQANLFVQAVTSQPPEYEDSERLALLVRFCKLCMCVEPGRDLEAALEKFRAKFVRLDAGVQQHWIAGFALILSDLYQKWYEYTRGLLEVNSTAFASDHFALIHALVEELRMISRRVIKAFDYTQFDLAQPPDLLALLCS